MASAPRAVADVSALTAGDQLKSACGEGHARSPQHRRILNRTSCVASLLDAAQSHSHGESFSLPVPLQLPALGAPSVASLRTVQRRLFAHGRVLARTRLGTRLLLSPLSSTVGGPESQEPSEFELRCQDVSHEVAAVGILQLLNKHWEHVGVKACGLPVAAQTYGVEALADGIGLVEVVRGSVSLGELKRCFVKGDVAQRVADHLNYDPQRLARLAATTAAFLASNFILGAGGADGDNIMLNDDGTIFRVDFGYLFGRRPTFVGVMPFDAPVVCLPRAVTTALGSSWLEVQQATTVAFRSAMAVLHPSPPLEIDLIKPWSQAQAFLLWAEKALLLPVARYVSSLKEQDLNYSLRAVDSALAKKVKTFLHDAFAYRSPRAAFEVARSESNSPLAAVTACGTATGASFASGAGCSLAGGLGRSLNSAVDDSLVADAHFEPPPSCFPESLWNDMSILGSDICFAVGAKAWCLGLCVVAASCTDHDAGACLFQGLLWHYLVALVWRLTPSASGASRIEAHRGNVAWEDTLEVVAALLRHNCVGEIAWLHAATHSEAWAFHVGKLAKLIGDLRIDAHQVPQCVAAAIAQAVAVNSSSTSHGPDSAAVAAAAAATSIGLGASVVASAESTDGTAGATGDVGAATAAAAAFGSACAVLRIDLSLGGATSTERSPFQAGGRSLRFEEDLGAGARMVRLGAARSLVLLMESVTAEAEAEVAMSPWSCSLGVVRHVQAKTSTVREASDGSSIDGRETQRGPFAELLHRLASHVQGSEFAMATRDMRVEERLAALQAVERAAHQANASRELRLFARDCLVEFARYEDAFNSAVRRAAVCSIASASCNETDAETQQWAREFLKTVARERATDGIIGNDCDDECGGRLLVFALMRMTQVIS